MLSDRSMGARKEITGVTTLGEAAEALTLLRGHGVTDEATLHSYVHVGWTGLPRVFGEELDPLGRTTSIALWAEVKGA